MNVLLTSCGDPKSAAAYLLLSIVCLSSYLLVCHCHIHAQDRTGDGDGGCNFSRGGSSRGDAKEAKRDSDTAGAAWMADPKHGQQQGGGGRGRILSSLSKQTPNTFPSEVSVTSDCALFAYSPKCGIVRPHGCQIDRGWRSCSDAVPSSVDNECSRRSRRGCCKGAFQRDMNPSYHLYLATGWADVSKDRRSPGTSVDNCLYM